MLEDYKKAVLFKYQQKKDEGLLSLNLLHPSPARLRDECLLVLNRTTQKKDEQMIRDFFNNGIPSNDYSASIRRFDVDRLRPLVRYIRNQIEDTADRNIELLSWLINFEVRPYNPNIDYNLPQPCGKPVQQPDITISHPPEDNPPNDQDFAPMPNAKTLTKYNIIDIIILPILIVGGICLSMRNAEHERSTKAFICTSKVSKKYHLDFNCRGLKNCKSEIKQTTIAEAKSINKTACEIEH